MALAQDNAEYIITGCRGGGRVYRQNCYARWLQACICPDCNGEGKVAASYTMDKMLGLPYSINPETTTCPTCEGKGYIWVNEGNE